MKSSTSVSTSLGLTQLELAMLLGVSRTQISMFEIGHRSLPVPAMQKLAALHTQLKEYDTHASKNPKPENKALLEKCRKAYEENLKYKLYRLEKKLAQLEKKRATAQKLKWLAQGLQQGKGEDRHGVHTLIGYRANAGLDEKLETAWAKLWVEVEFLRGLRV